MEYIKRKRQVYIPYMKVGVKFIEKEEVSLNAFQIFLLDAIMEGASISQMEDATQLTGNVIESELLQLEAQKLVIKKEDDYELTDLSNKILLVAKSIRSLNNEKQVFCLNLITGVLESFDDAEFQIPDKDELILKRKMISLDGLSIEDNMDFFAKNLETFKTMDDESVEIVLSSIYAEFNVLRSQDAQSTIYYKERELFGIPCLIGDDTIYSENKENSVLIEAAYKEVSFLFTTNLIQKYKQVIPDVSKLGNTFPELISEEAKKILKENELCESYNANVDRYIFDSTSGKYGLMNEYTIEHSKRKAQLILGESIPFDEGIKREMIDTVRNKMEITSDEVIVLIKNVKDDIYKIEAEIEQLMWKQ